MLDRIARDQGIDPGRLEVWFCDEARVGQKTQLTRRWAKRGTRPVALQDQRRDCRKIGGQAAIAIGGHGSLAGWNFCPKPELSVPL